MSQKPAAAAASKPVPVTRPKPAAMLIAVGLVLGFAAAAANGFGGPEFAVALGLAAVSSLAVGVYRIVSAVDAIAAERYNSTIR